MDTLSFQGDGWHTARGCLATFSLITVNGANYDIRCLL